MKQYEFITTCNCTRDCAFCYVQKSQFMASLDDAKAFISEISRREDADGIFDVVFFGGEPLMNIGPIAMIAQAMHDKFKNCKMHIITNCDLLNSVDVSQFKDLMTWHLSAYDIFNDSQKYAAFAKMFKDVVLSYTFTEDDLHLVGDFQHICCQLGIAFKTSFSHSASSWRSISAKDLAQKVFGIVHDELRMSCEAGQLTFLVKYPLQRMLGNMLCEDQSAHLCCDASKLTFLNGHFVGHCIRCAYQSAPHLELKACMNCEYCNVCSSSCVFELENGEVNDKLCALQRAQYDAICQFAKDNVNNSKWRKVVHYTIDECK